MGSYILIRMLNERAVPQNPTALSFETIYGCRGWMVGWYENEQKVGRRDVRAKALSWDDEWDKARK